MNLEIENGCMNGLCLGTSKSKFDKNIATSSGVLYELEDYEGEEYIATLSARDVKSFILDGQEINFDNLTKFLESENPLVDDDIYVFPNHNLTLIPDFEDEIFSEVLIYHERVKDLFVESYDDYYLNLKR